MNLIFLDIDGVLNCQIFYEQRTKEERLIESPIRNICKERVQWLNELCENVNAKVVISSTWRHSGLKYMKDILKEAGATFDIIDITPDLRFEGAVRGNEIKLWIDTNIERLSGIKYFDYKSYVIIDDDSDMLYWQRNNFFQTDHYSGLTPNTCHRVKMFFGGKKYEE